MELPSEHSLLFLKPALTAEALAVKLITKVPANAARGLPTMLREELGIPVFVADDPLLAVVKGAGMVLEDIDGYKQLLID
jgi:actin-like ATPase involved in cell morphogenesis